MHLIIYKYHAENVQPQNTKTRDCARVPVVVNVRSRRLRHIQHHPPPARAFIHIPMCLDHLIERIHLDDLRRQQLVGGELVDIAQGTLQRNLVLADASSGLPVKLPMQCT